VKKIEALVGEQKKTSRPKLKGRTQGMSRKIEGIRLEHREHWMNVGVVHLEVALNCGSRYIRRTNIKESN